jgi:hypothetical protein
MRTFLKTMGLLTVLLVFITALIVLITAGFGFYREVSSPTPTLPSQVPQFTQIVPSTRILEVATGKPTTASSFYRGGNGFSFPPSAIVDRYIIELDCTIGVERGNIYWLLADKTTGWVQVNLQQTYPIVKLRWLNTHNGDCGDRATTQFHIALSPTGIFGGEQDVVHRGRMDFSFSPQYQEVILSTPVPAQYVRFYVDAYDNWGGGLNELEVYADIANP